MTQAMMVSAEAVRDYLKLNASNPTGNSQYTAATISSNILAAQNTLEQATHRWFSNRPDATYIATSNNDTTVTIPGFRAIDGVTSNGSDLTVNESYWAIPDSQQSGIYLGIQFRGFSRRGGGPWYWSDPTWWDRNLDSPWYPGGSSPYDLTVTGDGGYEPGTEPYALLHAVKVLAAFYTMRPNSLLADTAITAQGGVLNYSDMPNEVRDFIRSWRAGVQVVSVG